MEVQNELDGRSYSGESATKFFHLYPARLRETPAQDEDNNGTVSWLFLAVRSLDDIESFLELLRNSASDAGEDCFIEMNIVGAAEVDRLVSVLQPSAQTSANSTLVASGVSASSSAAISPAPMITSSVNYHQTEPATTTKLRPAPDIYHRLLWTPPQPTTSGDYVIGYKDRFDGVREMRLGGWRKDVEDEAFVSMAPAVGEHDDLHLPLSILFHPTNAVADPVSSCCLLQAGNGRSGGVGSVSPNYCCVSRTRY